MKIRNTISLCSIIAFIGCSNDDPDTLLFTEEVETKIAIKPLEAVEKSERLERYLKNGIRWRYEQPIQYEFDEGIGTVVEDDAPAGNDSNGNSETYTQERGVDESDIVEFDGKHIYVVNRNNRTLNDGTPSAQNFDVRILASNPVSSTATETDSITLENPFFIDGIYTYSQNDQTRLSVIGGSDTYHYTFDTWLSYLPTESNTQISFHDINNEGKATFASQITFDGTLVTSRRIDNTLYVVSRYSPQVEGLKYLDEDESAREHNEKVLSTIPLANLLPKQSSGGTSQPLFNVENCYFPEDPQNNEGYDSVLTISAINIQTAEISHSSCVLAMTHGYYVSPTGIYLLGSSNSETIIHQFLFEEGTTNYKMSGAVKGHLGWRNPAFRLSEHDGRLRIITSVHPEVDDTSDDVISSDSVDHYLSVLSPNPETQSLEIIAAIPNAAQPAPIGKPNEQIFSVRYSGDRAYVVTFEQTDPFYVIDLSKPDAPTIAGELSIPGFSTLLHVINARYVLGFGMDVIDDQMQGFKVELFDVTDMSTPQTVDKITIGKQGTWSALLQDHHALSMASPNADVLRFALPVEVHDLNDSASEPGWYPWQKSSLALFEVNDINGQASLRQTGEIVSESYVANEFPLYNSDRSVIHEETIHYVHGPMVWSAPWSAPEQATGPQ